VHNKKTKKQKKQKQKIKDFPKFVTEFCDSAIGNLDTCIYTSQCVTSSDHTRIQSVTINLIDIAPETENLNFSVTPNFVQPPSALCHKV
jgi:hypothetical protein